MQSMFRGEAKVGDTVLILPNAEVVNAWVVATE